MIKIALFFFLVVAALAYEGAPLNEKGEVIDTKEVKIAKEEHYEAWNKENDKQPYLKQKEYYNPHYDGHHDDHYHEGHHDDHHHEGHHDDHHYDHHDDHHYDHHGGEHVDHHDDYHKW